VKLNPRQRWLIIGSLLAATIGAGLWLDDEAPDTAASPRAQRTPKPVSGTPGSEAGATAGARSLAKAETGETAEDSEADEDGDKDKDDGETLIDPFRPASWYVAPPPPPPEKPKAPRLPFKYLGRLVEDGSVRVFLSDQDRHLIVKSGEVVNGSYKVEKISDGQIVFIYLPLKERQILPTGGD
jgi:hypothetical protein